MTHVAPTIQRFTMINGKLYDTGGNEVKLPFAPVQANVNGCVNPVYVASPFVRTATGTHACSHCGK